LGWNQLESAPTNPAKEHLEINKQNQM